MLQGLLSGFANLTRDDQTLAGVVAVLGGVVVLFNH